MDSQSEREAAVFSITDCDHGGQQFEVYEQGHGAIGHYDTRDEAERVMAALAGRAELEETLRALVERVPPCNCIDGYKSRNLIDPQCIFHEFEDVVEPARALLPKATEGDE